VVGIGQNQGIVGGSVSGTGVYASSVTNYGVWGQSTEYRGVTGRTGRTDNNYGLYTPDNLFAKNYTSVGTTSEVYRYTGGSDIRPGDVVSFSGIEINADNAPMATVDSINSAPDAAIAGVVASRFNLDAVKDTEESDKIDPTPAGDIKPGDYVLVVVRGATPVNITDDTPRPAPGSLLVSDAENRTLDAVSPNRFSPASAAPTTGQTIGVVLGELPMPADKTNRTLQKDSATRQVYVYVSPR